MQRLSKIKIKIKGEDEVNFALEDDLMESLCTLRSKEELPVLEVLKILRASKTDSISLSKDRPFHFLYVRKNRNCFDITLRESEKEVEFKMPIKALDEYYR